MPDGVGGTVNGVGGTVGGTVNEVGGVVDNTTKGLGGTTGTTVKGLGQTVDTTIKGVGGTVNGVTGTLTQPGRLPRRLPSSRSSLLRGIRTRPP